MGAGPGFDPLFIIAIAAGVGLLAALVLIGSQLAKSTSAAKQHLDNASAFLPMMNAAPSGALDGAGPGATRGTNRPSGFVTPNDLLRGGRARPTVTSASGDHATPLQTLSLLNEYYLANISQGETIFWASLLAMSLGFAIIVIGVVLAGVHSTTAIIAAIAGVLSQFIGATFLIVLRSTQAQATSYAQSLVDLRLHEMRAAAEATSVALGLQLLAEIADDGADVLANQTRAAIAMGLIVGTSATAPVPPAPTVPIDSDKGSTDSPARTRAESITYDQTPARASNTSRSPESPK